MTEDLWKGACEMTEKELTGKVEVAHITGIQGIRAAMEVLEREATQEGEADVPAARRDARGRSAGASHLRRLRRRQRRRPRNLLELRRVASPRAVGA